MVTGIKKVGRDWEEYQKDLKYLENVFVEYLKVTPVGTTEYIVIFIFQTLTFVDF